MTELICSTSLPPESFKAVHPHAPETYLFGLSPSLSISKLYQVYQPKYQAKWDLYPSQPLPAAEARLISASTPLPRLPWRMPTFCISSSSFSCSAGQLLVTVFVSVSLMHYFLLLYKQKQNIFDKHKQQEKKHVVSASFLAPWQKEVSRCAQWEFLHQSRGESGSACIPMGSCPHSSWASHIHNQKGSKEQADLSQNSIRCYHLSTPSRPTFWLTAVIFILIYSMIEPMVNSRFRWPILPLSAISCHQWVPCHTWCRAFRQESPSAPRHVEPQGTDRCFYPTALSPATM